MSTSIPSTTTTVTATDIARMCEAADWYYAYSDDGDVYRAGKEAEARLRKLAAAAGPAAMRIVEAWDTYVAAVSRGNKDTAVRPTRAQFDLAEDAPPVPVAVAQLAKMGRSARHLNADALVRGEYDSAWVAAYLYKRREDAAAVAAGIAESARDNVFTLYGRRWAWVRRADGDGCQWEGWDPSKPYHDVADIVRLPDMAGVVCWVLLRHW